MSTYLLSYDASAPMSQSQIDAFISGSKFVEEWSFLYAGAYFIRSSNNIDDFISNFSSYFAGNRFVVVRLSGDTNEVVNGKISPEIWQWLSGMSSEEYWSQLDEYHKRLAQVK